MRRWREKEGRKQEREGSKVANQRWESSSSLSGEKIGKTKCNAPSAEESIARPPNLSLMNKCKGERGEGETMCCIIEILIYVMAYMQRVRTGGRPWELPKERRKVEKEGW